jgi:isoleucyl-tRNA synthetase
MRFLLANLYDFAPDAETKIVTHVDQMMLRRIDDLVARTRRAYEDYALVTVHRNLVEFVTTDLSAFYCDIVKDRLYAEAPAAERRRSAQAVLYAALRAVTVLASPILCFTTEDVWRLMPRRAGDPESVHMAILDAGAEWAETDPLRAAYERLRVWRDKVNAALEPFRAAKHKSLDAFVTINPRDEVDHKTLWTYLNDLTEWFIVSDVQIRDVAADGAEPEVVVREHGGKRCERCWIWYEELAAAPADVCERCADALAAIGSAP